MANTKFFTSLSRRLLPLTLMLGAFITSSAQDYEVTTMANRRGEFVPGELIVKFKDTSSVRMRAPRAVDFRSTTVDAVDQTFRALGVQQVEELMPLTGGAPLRQNVRSFSGSTVPSAPMALAYRVTLSPDANIFDAINQLQALDQVEYAEPNYLVYTLEDKDPDDPYYTDQYGIQDVNLYNLWGMPVLSKEGPVIAILDTGVDITHPDLIDNIWTNTSESDGAYKFDDDGNGFVDDVHGWDFVNQTGDIFDYNGHGTHCAGIAAATGYNGKGIIGANPDARIMPITVMQSNGTGNIATIIKGIDYAAANGAAIISMSLGTYSTSTAFEQALGRAYQKCVLVAAAGNDGYSINDYPVFPAAYSFVFGVQASQHGGGLAGFSNYDDNGPIFSGYEAQYNYELTVPGASVVSTFPNGQYKYLNGTSMATPLAAGAISRLLQAKEYTNKEILFGDLINCLTSKGNTDFYAAYQITDEQRTPELQVTTFAIEDPEGDNDGRPDAGELINIYPTIRNAWGTAKNIRIKLECAETINNVYTPVVDEVDFGWELSAYGSARSANPLQIRLKDDVVDGRIIMLKLIVTGDNAENVEQPFEITAENGVEILGIITEDMTLYPNVHYIVTGNCVIPSGVTLTILPGTVIKFKDNSGFKMRGNIVADGKPGNMITFMPTDDSKGRINGIEFPVNDLFTLSYLKFVNFDTYYLVKNAFFNNCIFNHNTAYEAGNNVHLNKCNVMNSTLGSYTSSDLECTNLIENTFGNGGVISEGCGTIGGPSDSNSFSLECVVHDYYLFSYYYETSYPMVLTLKQPNYLGSAREDIVQPLVIDIRTGFGFGQYDLSNMRTRPVAQAHGIVWKVVVDGYDAQDEYESLPPLGVGRHKFKVYFNRPMNHDKAPMIAMGLREPYTQTAIAEDGSWSSEVFDGETVDIYTAYLTLRGKDNIDGVNTIYVAQAEDDEFFEIPVERRRFHVNVQSAGSLSAGFMAEAGVGKVSLSWDNTEENFDDMLGYNLYRYTLAEDGSQSEPACINRSLITPDETEFVDYDITPGTTYCYYYKVLSTSLTENSPSKVVAATPRAASKGDANGSGDVDVNDVVSIVNYMVGVDQRPFILDAADVNSDTAIDILDVVSTVNIILTPEQAAKPAATAENGVAIYYVEDGVLYVDSPVALSGVDLTFAATPRVSSFTPMADIAAMEVTGGYVANDLYRVVIFSAAGKAIPAGRTALLRIADADIEAITLADTRANRVDAQAADESGVSEAVADQVLRPWPNPFKDFINVPVTVAANQDGKVTVTLVNLAGQIVAMQSLTLQPGDHTVTLATDALPQGFYLLNASVDNYTVLTEKVIKR